MPKRLPWQLKIAAKLVLARLPVSYPVWRKLNLFALGSMLELDYAYRVFEKHFQKSPFQRKATAFNALELGPGDSLLSAVVSKAFGAASCELVDAGHYAHASVSVYRNAAERLRQRGKGTVPDLAACRSVPDILSACSARYGTEGIRSLAKIPTASIDFIWSHTVLQHVRRNEFDTFLSQLRRIIRDDGVCSHRVDLTDMIGGALNHLRFSTHRWESEWMAKSGFYTNRLRYPEYIDRFAEAGFSVRILAREQWEELPTPRAAMAREFLAFSDEDLRVSGFDVLLFPNGSTSGPNTGANHNATSVTTASAT